MQIPNVRNSVTAPVNYFLQSSWKGRTVEVLGVALIFAVIYCIAFRKKRPDRPPALLTGRVQRNPPAQSKEFPKADLSYIKKAPEQPDFVKEYQGEFGPWLSGKRESYERLVMMANGTPVQQANVPRALQSIVSDLRALVEKMVPRFKAHPDIKVDDWDLFLSECDAVADRKDAPEVSCEKLKKCLDQLQAWNGVLQKEHQTKFMQQVGDATNYPHYEITNLQTQYFHYLGLRSENDFSTLLTTERGYLATLGLSEMKDVDCLELRTMQPSIERLRQLFCFVNITGDEERLRPLIQKEIESCREILRGSDTLSDILTNGQELKDCVKRLRTSFSGLEKIFRAQGLALLKEIEQKDIARQLIQLKGYIHRRDHFANSNQNGEGCFQLSAYAEFLGTDASLSAFYK